MTRANVRTVLATMVLAVGCGDCGSDEPPVKDLGYADMAAADLGMDEGGPVTDAAEDLSGEDAGDLGDADLGAELGPSFEDVVWQTMNGPEGGSHVFLQEDPYHPDELYMGTVPGLYRTVNGGDDWTLLLAESVGTHVAFEPDRLAACTARGLFVYDGQWAAEPLLSDGCDGVWVDDGRYVAASAWEPGPGAFDINIQLGSAPDFVWQDISPDGGLLAQAFAVDGADPSGIVAVESMVIDGDHIAALIALKSVATAGSLFVTHDAGASWSVTTIGSNPNFGVTKVIADPSDRSHLLAILYNRDSDAGMYVPLSELVWESSDHGTTWASMTTVSDVFALGVQDIDLIGEDVFLTDVDMSIVQLAGPDYDAYTRSGWPTVPGYSFGYAVEDLVFDPTDSERVWARGRLGWDGVIRSLDGMVSWERTVSGVVASATPNLTVHPDDPDIVMASGNLGFLPHITRDHGESWEPLVGTNQMADEAAFNPHDPQQLLMISERSAMVESRDGGETWDSLAATFRALRVPDVSVASDGRIYASNMGTNIGVHPMGGEDGVWSNLLYAPDYAYDIEADLLDPLRLYATSSPKPFETHAALYRYDESDVTNPGGWKETLRVPNATGMSSIAIDPSEPTRIYAASTGVEPALWRSADRGETWARLHPDSGLTFSTVHVTAVDPNDELHVIAAPWGGRLFETIDGGSSWVPMPCPTPSVSAILFDPGEPLHLRIGDRTQPIIWESFDGGTSWAPLVMMDPEEVYRIMAMADFDGDLYFSAMDRPSGGPFLPTGTTYRLDATPIAVPGALGRSALAFAPGPVGMYAVGHMYGVYKLEGGQFYDISGTLPDMGFNSVLRARDGTVFVAGGSDIGLDLTPRIGDPTVVNEIYRTSDDGQTWTALLGDDRFGAPIKVLAQHPVVDDVLVAATTRGLWVSKDYGASWQKQSGLGFEPIASMQVTGSHVYVGTLGGGVYRGTFDAQHDVTWDPSTGPQPEVHNVQLDVDPGDPSVLYASAFPGGVFKTTDGGSTWDEVNFAVPSFEVADPLSQGYYALQIDPLDADVLYLGVYRHGIFKSTDGATTWLPLVDPLVIEAPVRDLAIDGGTLYAATETGVLSSDDGGASWTSMNAGLDTLDVLTIEARDGTVTVGTAGYGAWRWSDVDARWEYLGLSIGIGQWATWDRRLYQYSALLFDPVDPARIYLGNFPGGFFISEDQGQHWESHSIGIGNDGIFSLTVHPADPDILFAGTYNGIIRSNDRGQSWSSTGSGIPDQQWPFAVVIDDENPDRMYLTTKNGQNKGFCGRNTFCGVLMRSDDGGATWDRIMNGMDDQREYYMLIIHPADHDVLFVSTSKGVFASSNGGDSWTPMNAGLPTTEHRIRDNVAQNLKLAPDDETLYLGVVDYGVWTADLSVLGL